MKTASRIGVVNKRRPDKIARLANKIAAAIYEQGDNTRSRDRCTRVQFMLGKWPDERPNGGLCRSAMASVIAMTLRENR